MRHMMSFASSHSAPRRRALFVAYTFPPVGGAGVQRTTKFVKYLPQFGWDASVLTVSNPSVPVRDATLCRDVPASTHVVRAPTFEPSYATKAAIAAGGATSGRPTRVTHLVRRCLAGMLQPDPQVLWNLPAFVSGIRALRQVPHHAIIASAPPFSSLLLGTALSAATNVPLVMDYRDEWDVSNKYWENRQIGRTSAAIQRAMERCGLRRASAVIATSPRSAAALQASCRDADATAVVTHIFNGFDPEDFEESACPLPRRRDGVWRLVYTGTLYNLMSPEPLVQAIEALAAIRPDLIARLELVFAGRHAAEQSQRLARVARLCGLRILDYVSHSEAIALMRSADALCVLLSDLTGADRVIPAKLFEYIASERPILAIAPPGDVWDLLHAHPAAYRCKPDDVTGVREWLANAIGGRGAAAVDHTMDTEPFNRRWQAQQLASLLDRLAPRRRPLPLVWKEEDPCSV